MKMLLTPRRECFCCAVIFRFKVCSHVLLCYVVARRAIHEGGQGMFVNVIVPHVKKKTVVFLSLWTVFHVLCVCVFMYCILRYSMKGNIKRTHTKALISALFVTNWILI